MKAKILTVLKNNKDYVSGQDLCNQLGVSRTAIWKVIKQLKEEGYKIDAVSNKGYRMVETPDVLSEEELKSAIHTERFGKKVGYYEELSSTNIQAKILAEQEQGDGLLVVADMQSAGKGRRGRGWVSQKGTGIWMSLVLKPDIKPANASMITLVVAMAVATAIQKVCGLEAKIKWPNDIVINGKKVCGILTEMSSEIDFIHYVVVGIGINANIECFPEEIKDIATSLYLEVGKKVKRSECIAVVMKEFEHYFCTFCKKENLSGILEEYNEILVNRGKKVKVIEAKQEYEGEAIGINKQGELLIRLEDNTIKTVVSGEVSVRGIYGYV